MGCDVLTVVFDSDSSLSRTLTDQLHGLLHVYFWNVCCTVENLVCRAGKTIFLSKLFSWWQKQSLQRMFHEGCQIFITVLLLVSEGPITFHISSYLLADTWNSVSVVPLLWYNLAVKFCNILPQNCPFHCVWFRMSVVIPAFQHSGRQAGFLSVQSCVGIVTTDYKTITT